MAVDRSGKPDAPSDPIERLIGTISDLNAKIVNLERKIDRLLPDAEAASAGPVSVPSAHASASVLDNRDPGTPGQALVRLMIVGLRGHGRVLIEKFLSQDGCAIDIVCDVDTTVGATVVDEITRKTSRAPRYVRDIREGLNDPTIDAVVIATPHHWHALMAIWALQAGKHVYLEKPLSHNYREAESVLAAARKYKRVVQFGTQLRSNRSLSAAAKALQAGKFGKIEVVHCLVYKPRPAVPLTNQNKIPASVDYDQWCGPAPLARVVRSKFHYHWHWSWDFGNGAIGNNGIHRVDVARIGMGTQLPGLGDRVLSFGGRFGGADSGETPNVQVVIHRFGDRWVIQELIGLPVQPFKTVTNGVIFYGAEGRNVIYQNGAARLTGDDGKALEDFPGKQASHHRNFLDAVRADDPSAVTGDLYEGHLSSALCHLGNISYRLGREAEDQEIHEEIERLGAPPKVLDVLRRVRANLTSNAEQGSFTLGETLTVDINAADGPIVGNERAKNLLGREARAGYPIPAPEAV